MNASNDRNVTGGLRPDALCVVLVRAVASAIASLHGAVGARQSVAAARRTVTEQPGRYTSIAEWMVRQYPAGPYPALVVGSSHGAAAHLAAALGSPWLPANYEVEGPDGPAHVRWPGLPDPYRRFVLEALTPGATIVLLRDVRRPDEASIDPRLVAELCAVATAHGHCVRQVLIHGPEVLSGAVADLYRQWLRAAGRTGNRLVVESGRLIAPWQVLRAGLVPYWCESPTSGCVEALEWWVAGSEPFSSIDVLVEPPGSVQPGMAEPARFAGLARFGTRRGVVDRRCARAYPLGAVPLDRATAALRDHPYDTPYLSPIHSTDAIASLAAASELGGLLVL